MATAQLAPSTVEQRLVLSAVDWQTYKAIADALGERPIRITYDGRRMEIMTTSPRHEGWKSFLARMLEALSDELGIDIACFGSMTMQREDMARGFEPDECYYIQHEPLVRNRLDLDFDHDPPPDLAIEVEISRSVLDRISIYAAMGVRELWRFDGERFRILLLNEAGQYEPSETSPSFPRLPLDEFVRFLRQRESLGDSQTVRAFRAWVRANLLPPPPAAGGPPAPAL
jgi:Uma2 family endonuclease